MKRILDILKSAILTGLLIVLPAWLALLLLLKVFVQFTGLVKPISNHVPDQFIHPQLVAILLFLLICLLVGIVVQTTIGSAVGKVLGGKVFNRIPGYQSFRRIAQQVTDLDTKEGFKPALIEVEDGSLSPAFLIEEHKDGSNTVFLPSVPTPMAGSILIMPGGRVHPINVPVSTMMKCISQWGSGSAVLLAALEKSRSDTSLEATAD